MSISSDILDTSNIFKKCDKMNNTIDDNNINNGLITKIWGPALWTSLHSITFGYPVNPTKDQMHDYYNFFKLVGKIMPCKYCRESYQIFINEGNTKLTINDLKNRDSLTKWLYNVHNAVNDKLGVYYGVTFNDVQNRYESYRAKCSKDNKLQIKGCVTPLNDKQLSYKMANYKECPIIPVYIAKELEYYGNIRGIIDEYFINEYKKNMKNYKKHGNLNCNKWYDRNIECNKLISEMRVSGISSIESDGVYKGLPTIHEMKLILKMASNLSIDELYDVLKIWNKFKIDNKIVKNNYIIN